MATCPVCRVDFAIGERGAHSQTNFHKVNLERSASNEPPLTYQEYCSQLVQKASPVFHSTHIERHSCSLVHTCFICNMDERDPRILLTHLNDRHFYHVKHSAHIVDPEGLVDEISLFSTVYHRCLECGLQLDNCNQLLNHLRKSSHSYAINELTSQYFDFTEEWPEEMRDQPGCRSCPFELFDPGSMQRFRKAGIIGDFRKPRPYIEKDSLLGRGMALTGRVGGKAEDKQHGRRESHYLELVTREERELRNLLRQKRLIATILVFFGILFLLIIEHII